MSSQKAAYLRDYVDAVSDNVNLVFMRVNTASSLGQSDGFFDCHDIVLVSDHPLSAVVCLKRISTALARKWNNL
ncbi:unnamed protein product [Prunus armeniaca]|uniref:Uncharacterized protein n=1 Tax=Prunus armeniaca TaxID=36596 RepID=A0A6J5TXK3_PRUAR|nr:unnamed protein product [Prunus armeniaca]